jgi:hypothetical protein
VKPQPPRGRGVIRASSFADCEAEKRASRQRDLDMLDRGEITPEELNEQNGALVRAMRGAKIDFSRARSLG